MAKNDYDADFHGKRRPRPRRGQVKAAIAASLARSFASVTSGLTSTVKKSLSSRRSAFSSIRSDASFSFTSYSSSARSQAGGTCWDTEDYVEGTNDTNTVGHLKICSDHLYS